MVLSGFCIISLAQDVRLVCTVVVTSFANSVLARSTMAEVVKKANFILNVVDMSCCCFICMRLVDASDT